MGASSSWYATTASTPPKAATLGSGASIHPHVEGRILERLAVDGRQLVAAEEVPIGPQRALMLKAEKSGVTAALALPGALDARATAEIEAALMGTGALVVRTRDAAVIVTIPGDARATEALAKVLAAGEVTAP